MQTLEFRVCEKQVLSRSKGPFPKEERIRLQLVLLVHYLREESLAFTFAARKRSQYLYSGVSAAQV